MDVNQIKKGAQVAFEIMTLAKKEGWFDKSWSRLTVAGFLLTLISEQFILPLLAKNGVDVSNFIIDIPNFMYGIGAIFTSVYMAMTHKEKK
jgi:hypothetical protein